MREGELVSGKYNLIRCLGKGGMGEVWLACHTLLNKQVALKFLYPNLLSECTYEEIKRLRHDLGYILFLNHPNIMQVRDFESYQGAYFTVMDYVGSHNLHDLITRNFYTHESFSEMNIISYVLQILSALSYAHKRGIIHCNLRPSKIFINEKDEIYLSGFIDAIFGDYYHLHNKLLVGAMPYTDPIMELSNITQNASVVSDIYSLGIIMYEIATNKLPYWGPESLEIKLGHKYPKAPNTVNSQISPKLSSIIMKAIQLHPEDRFQSAKEMSKALEQCKHK